MREPHEPHRHDALARRAQRGDAGARALLLARIDRVLITVARKYYGIDSADLVQEARLGAIRALEKWKPGGGMGFLAYCVLWVRGRCGFLVKQAAVRRRTELHLAPRGVDGDELDEDEGLELSDYGGQADTAEAGIDGASLGRLLNRMNWTESFVIRRRMAGDTFKTVGHGRHLSRERIRTLEPELLAKLRRRARVTGVIARG